MFFLSELVSGDKEHRRKMRLKMAAAKNMAKLAKQKKKDKQASDKAKAEEAAKSFMQGISNKKKSQQQKQGDG